MAQGLGVKLLPLVDVEQEPLGALLVGCRQKAADATTEGAVRRAQDLNLLLDAPVGLERR